MRVGSIAAALASGVCIVAMSSAAQAQQRQFNIPAGSLQAALDSYGRQAGRAIIYKSDDVSGIKSRGFVGAASADVALKAILPKSGFVTRVDSSGAVAIVKSGVSSEGSGESPSSGEIIVTATRRAQTAQGVPLSLTAVGADQLSREGITSTGQLGQLAPSLYVMTYAGEGTPRISMRGLTATDGLKSGAPTVAIYVDDVYQGFQYGVSSALFDLQRIEILRGPQGTTFGKNTTGGAVAYFAQVPTNEWEGYVTGRLAGGDQPQRFLEGAVNVPIVDGTLAMRFSGRVDSKSNWIRDIANDRGLGQGDGQSGRFQLRWTPSDETTVNLTIFGSRWRGDPAIGIGQLMVPSVPKRVVGLNAYDLYEIFDNTGATLRVEQGLGSFSLTAISHFRRTRHANAQDPDGLPVDAFFFSDRSLVKQYGQEVRLASDPEKRLSGIIGAYYEHSRNWQENTESSVFLMNTNQLSRQLIKTDTPALFGTLTAKLTDSLSVVGGLRKTFEKRTLDGQKLYFLNGNYDWTQGNVIFDGPPPILPNQDLTYQARAKSRPWTWDATINYHPDRSLLIFARVADGFRSCAFNRAPTVFNPAFLPAPRPPLCRSETVQSYEVGVKSTLLGDVLRVNAGVFRYDFSDQQVTQYGGALAGGFPILIVGNAAKSRVEGGEIELTVSPDEHWQLRGSASYTDARYRNYVVPGFFDYTGNRLQLAPEWTANASVNYTTPVSSRLDLRATTVWSYRSRIFFDSSNDPEVSAGGVAKGSVRVGIVPNDSKGLSVTAFVDNLTNKRPLAAGAAFEPGVQYLKYFETGRSFGLDLSYHW